MDGKVVSRSSPRRGVPREEGSLYRLWLWRKKQFYRKAWICGFVDLEEVPLKSADQRDGGVRKEPVDKGEVHLEIPFCTLFWI